MIMEFIKIESREKSWPRSHAFMTAALLVFFMVSPAAPEHWSALYSVYGRCAIIATLALYFWKCGLRGTVEVKLVIWYAIWLFVTRLLNTDYYLENEFDLVLKTFLCVAVLSTGLVLDPTQRRRFFDIVIAIVGGFYFIVAILAIAACFLGIYFYIPPENIPFGIDTYYLYANFYFIAPFGTNRTISAAWFYIAGCLMVYEFLNCRRKLWRIPIVLAWLVFYIAVALSFCRSIKLAMCVNAAMLVILGGMKLIKMKSNALKALLIAVLALVSMPLVYKSFDLTVSAAQAAYDWLDPDVERISDPYVGRGQVQEFGDTRDLKESVSNMSNRGNIFASIIPTIKEDPTLLLIGKYSHQIMDIPHKYQNYPYFHMHNYLVQTLMLAGVVGLLLVLAFSVMLVIKMIRLFFSRLPGVTAAVKTLTLPLSGIFIYGMMETAIFTNCADDRVPTDFRELAFFLIAGIFLGFYYDAFPAKKKGGAE